MRLGFPVTILGRGDLRSHDARRWQNHPHLSVSLAYLRDLFLYLRGQKIYMYRLSAEIAPYLTHPALPQFHHQIEECETQLVAIGETARKQGLRLSFHAGAHVLLNTPDPNHKLRSLTELEALTRILDAMNLDEEAVIVVHVGGHYQNARAAMEEFVKGFKALSANARRRVVLEHDDRRFDVVDCLWIHEQTGVRLIFDLLHHQLHNPHGLSPAQALAACLATWPPGQTPKIHVATPATEMVRDRRGRPHPPRLNRHSHYINPFPIIDFLRSLPPIRDFDIMLEAKARDLALLQFRQHLARYAPDLQKRYKMA
ncbi:MAG: UV DNA damage repair endonuclease UvsE [Chloroflexi bacterium]|nr:UV DNA damage repair endonuclease UvsE [Chloroflexota bacterium]